MKRAVSILLCIALVLCLSPVASASDITFLAVNDSIPMTLAADTMPFYANSLLYIPISVFNIAALGIVPFYDSAARVLTLYNDVRSLTFDLDESTMTNENGTIFTVQVIARGGTLFVPALYCAYHFGLSISFLTSLGGYSVVRFTTGSQVYDDELFIEKANNLIEYRASQYLDSLTPQGGSENENENGTGTVDEQPNQPATTDPPQNETEPDPPVETQPAVLYLAITNADGMAGTLEALERRSLHAAFFFSADEIESHTDLILQLYAAGHTIGLVADGNEAEANELLDRILKTKALCMLATDGESSLSEAGIIFSAAAEQPSLADALLIEGTPQLYLVDSSALAGLLAAADAANAKLPQLRETTKF